MARALSGLKGNATRLLGVIKKIMCASGTNRYPKRRTLQMFLGEM